MNPASSWNPDPAAREVELAAAREIYQFDYQYEGLGFMKGKLDVLDQYSKAAYHTLLSKQVLFLANHAVAKATPVGTTSRVDDIGTLLRGIIHELEQVTKFLEGPDKCESLLRAVTAYLLEQHADKDTRATSLDDYTHMFQLLKAPPGAQYWDEDWYFAYCMVTCVVPNHLICLDKLPPDFLATKFPVTNEMYVQATGDAGGLAAAIAQRRVFLADFSRYATLSGTKKFGAQLVTSAPMALFAWCDTDQHGGFGLRPVAIQCAQSSPDTPIFTPADQWRWKMARLCVLGAIGLYSGTSVHFGTHLLMSRIVLSTYRQVTREHPIYRLLHPNFQFTLAVNHYTEEYSRPEFYPKEFKSYLVGLMSPPREESMAMARAYVDNFRLNRSAPPETFGDRGLDDPRVLPMYPFRDDTMRLWKPIRTFVEAYVDVYYSSDADVAADVEIQAWVSALQDQGDQGGRLQGVGVQAAPDQPGVVHTKQALADLAAQIMYQASAYHAALNYSNYEFLSMPLVMSYSAFEGPPTLDTPNTEAAFMQRCPPMGYAWMQFHFADIQHMLWENWLGQYRKDYFLDPTVQAAAKAFADELHVVELAVIRDNQQRPVPYNHQLPSRVTASIQN